MTTLLVDATNIFMRACKAAGHTALRTDEGTPTGTLLLFINALSRHIRDEKPDKVVACWDGGRSVYRTDIWPGYKAHRASSSGDDTDRPIAQVKEFLTLAGIGQAEVPGVEADDVVTQFWRMAFGRTVILSGDRDFLQLVDDYCTLVTPLTGGTVQRWTTETVQDKYGCQPENFCFVKALMGDPSDGIPGLQNIGPVRAARLLREAGTWPDLLEKLSEADRALVSRNLSLVDLLSAPPLALDDKVPPFCPTSPGAPLYPALVQFLDHYQLTGIRGRLQAKVLWSDG